MWNVVDVPVLTLSTGNRAVAVLLWPLASWGCGFEFRWRYVR